VVTLNGVAIFLKQIQTRIRPVCGLAAPDSHQILATIQTKSGGEGSWLRRHRVDFSIACLPCCPASLDGIAEARTHGSRAECGNEPVLARVRGARPPNPWRLAWVDESGLDAGSHQSRADCLLDGGHSLCLRATPPHHPWF